MKEKAPLAKQKTDTEEELLNFDLEEISPEDLDQGSVNEEEEIIELVELVEKGDEERLKGPQLKGPPKERQTAEQRELVLQTDEIPGLQKIFSKEEVPREGDVLDVSDITLELNREKEDEIGAREVPEEGEITAADLEGLLVEEPGETVRLDIRGTKELGAKGKGEEEEITEADLEDLLAEELGEEKKFDTLEEVEPAPSTLSLKKEAIKGAKEVEPVLPEVEEALELEALAEEIEEKTELEKAPAEPELKAEFPAEPELPQEKPLTPPAPAFQELPGITEEKLEAVLTRVVQDVVGRVARETMASVAEKLILEAIDALKKSIESSSKE